MTAHFDLGKTAFARSRRLKELIDAGKVQLGGNKRLKIYGTLTCGSGKRMKVENRVFFESEEEAKSGGYRPCGHCMRQTSCKAFPIGHGDFVYGQPQIPKEMDKASL